MKIGILTFHRALNYGAVLQAYALSTYINSQKNCDCEIVDYYCPKIEKDYALAYFTINYHHYRRMLNRILSIPKTLRRKRAFEDFRRKYLCVSQNKYDPQTISSSNLKYDLFITGSDQVWDLNCAGFDENYFLTFVKDSSKKNSYGASFRLMQLPEEYKIEFNRRIHDFRNISCREVAGANMISNLIGRNVDVVVDPVMLLKKEDWNRICFEVPDNDYILVYTISDSENVKEVANRVATLSGKKIVVLGRPVRGYVPETKFISENGPDHFVSYIKKADCIITNSFHGSVFSLLFHKTLWIDNMSVRAGNARLNNLMKMLSIENFSIESILTKKNLSVADIWNPRPWNEIDQMIETKTGESRMYLKKVLDLEN